MVHSACRQCVMSALQCGAWAPRLLKLLTGKDRAALAACDRQLRGFMRRRTQAVCVQSSSAVHNILSDIWPQLALIVLQGEHMKPPNQDTTTHKMDVLAALALSQLPDQQRCTAFVVAAKPGHNQPRGDAASMNSNTTSAERSQVQLSAQQLNSHFAVAMTCVRKAGSQKVDSMVMHQRYAGTDYAAQMMSIGWPGLTNLDANLGWLTTAGITAVAMASLPSLQILNINGIAAEHVTLQWRWSQLKELTLRHICLSTAATDKLADAPWPHLSHLMLSSNQLGANHMQGVVSARMPELTYLWLDDNKLDGAATVHMAKAEWPKLRLLSLHDNNLDNSAAEHLSSGFWPEMHVLLLVNNVFTAVTCFSSDRWPGLGILTLEKQVLSVANLVALDLSCDTFSNVASVNDNKTLCASRRQKLASEQHG